MSEAIKFGEIKMSEGVRLDHIIPEVLGDIERRCNRYRCEHGLVPLGAEVKLEQKEYASRVLQATADFLRSKRPKRNHQREMAMQKVLF